MIERHFEVPFVARLALREKQIQQSYRPLIAVHKWFARRPGTLFRSLILSEFTENSIRQTFYQSQQMSHIRIFDPFMGGGTTMMEANRVGCAVAGTDVNPMAWWIVRQELGELDVCGYQEEAERLRSYLEAEVGLFYRTRCLRCKSNEARAKYFLWVKTAYCAKCNERTDLFPDFLISEDVRHPTNVFVCGCCGELFEASNRRHPGPCPSCGNVLPYNNIARRNKSVCKHCNGPVDYPSKSVPEHRMFAIEYHCESCGSQSVAGSGKGRLFKKPDQQDLKRYEQASIRLKSVAPRFIPGDQIPEGDETNRLHRWGYGAYRDLFNVRQLLGLELSCRWIAGVKNNAIREALATNLSDLTRYQNMLCRYDTMALKSLDIFSVHGFPVGLIQCESNFLGISGRKGAPVGSGGWLNIVEKFAKAKRYCGAPFEIRHDGSKKVEVPMTDEWIGISRTNTKDSPQREVLLLCADSASAKIGGKMFDAILTDPPYFGNVQYAELMDFCYVWLRTLLGSSVPEFQRPTTRHVNELTGNISMGRGLEHFAAGISNTIKRSANRLKPGGPLAFTYHHNQLEAYLPLTMAILDAGLVCSATLPCPAEMGASIHINGTGSSVVDTVFVCRSAGKFPRRWLATNPNEVAAIVQRDIELLAVAGLKATQGDIRCLACGHLARLAVWNLRSIWDQRATVPTRMDAIRKWFSSFGGLESVLKALDAEYSHANRSQDWRRIEVINETYELEDEISF